METTIWLLIKKNKYSGKGFKRFNKAVSQICFEISFQRL